MAETICITLVSVQGVYGYETVVTADAVGITAVFFQLLKKYQ